MRRVSFTVAWYVFASLLEFAVALATHRLWFLTWWRWPSWLYAGFGVWFAVLAWKASRRA